MHNDLKWQNKTTRRQVPVSSRPKASGINCATASPSYCQPLVWPGYTPENPCTASSAYLAAAVEMWCQRDKIIADIMRSDTFCWSPL
jgi:hypothetical protein